MLLLPILTTLLKPGDNLATVIKKEAKFLPGDILVLSSKAVATVEGAMIDLQTLTPSKEAKKLSEQTGRSPEFCEAMLGELRRLSGSVIGTCPGAALTEVHPEGLQKGTILTANAGLDESNAPKGQAIGWPRDAAESAVRLRKELEEKMRQERQGSKKRQRRTDSFDSFASSASLASFPTIAVILTDSCCLPRRHGVTAIALAVSGLDPLQSQKGKQDLFGKSLQITTEAIADQLATAANFLMGNAGQSVPAVIIRDHGLTLSDWAGWVPGIEKDQDMFKEML